MKNIKEEKVLREEYAFGIVPVFHYKNEYLFLIIRSKKNGHWGFPKGRQEKNEGATETALRELKEEVGIDKCKILNKEPFSEISYFNDRETPCKKIVKYFIGLVSNNEVSLQATEISEYKWLDFVTAKNTLSHTETIEVLNKAFNFLQEKRE